MNIISYQLLDKDQKISTLLSTQAINLSKHSPELLNSTYTPEIRIEQQLLRKYAKSQARLSAQRLSKQRQEARSMQPAPKINKTSKEIAELLEGKGEHTASGYATQIVSSCRSSAGFSMHPKYSFISLADLSDDPKHRKAESQQEIHLNLSTIKEQIKKTEKKNTQDPKTIERTRLEELKKIMACRKGLEELENSGEPLYEMGILERNQFWLDRKNQRIQMKQEERILEESKSCTFTPMLAPRINSSRCSRPSSQNSNSYAEKYKKKDVMSSTLQKPCKKNEEKPPKPTVSLYKALSPHSKIIRQPVGSSILKNAVPMLPYKT